MAVKTEGKVVLGPEDIHRALIRLAHEIVERNPGVDHMGLIGLRTRGAPLAARLAEIASEVAGRSIPWGWLDITPHRDDARPSSARAVGEVPFLVENAKVILVDEVICTGRSVRAAMEALLDYGRPAQVQLAVLIDRGHREMPIRPDYVGRNLPTSPREWVIVHLSEIDGEDRVYLTEPKP